MAFALRYIGTAAALTFIGLILVRHGGDIAVINLGSSHARVAMAGGFILYVLSQFVGAAAWRVTLSLHGVSLPRARAESQLLVSQIGKYVPGNVAHLLGRFALARGDGVSSAVFGSSLLLEVSFLLTSGVLIVGVLLLIMPDLVGAITSDLPELRLEASMVVVFIGLLICIAIGQFVIWRKAGKPKLAISKCIVVLSLHSFNFAILGISLWCVAQAIYPGAGASMWQCLAIFTTAWVAGFLMPGAPGGIGIRDGIITLGLGLFIDQGAGLSAAIAHRAISVLGDVILFGLGLTLRRNHSGVEQKSA
jgi:glycosyltransferase 2 family protein